MSNASLIISETMTVVTQVENVTLCAETAVSNISLSFCSLELQQIRSNLRYVSIDYLSLTQAHISIDCNSI